MVTPAVILLVSISGVALAAIIGIAAGRAAERTLVIAGFILGIALVVIPAMQVPGLLGRPDLARVFTLGQGGSLSIVLFFGAREAVLIAAVNLVALFAGMGMTSGRLSAAARLALLFAVVSGANGLVLARSPVALVLFLLVFLGAAAALAIEERNREEAGAGSAAVGGLLIAAGPVAGLAIVSRLIESAPESLARGTLWVGLVTFTGCAIAGVWQTNRSHRVVLSGAAQTGLVLAVLGLARLDSLSAYYTVIVAGGLLVTHALATSSMLFLGGARLGRPRRVAVLMLLLALAAIGLPPFPGFWARWQVLNTLLANGHIAALVVLVVGWVMHAVLLLQLAAADVPDGEGLGARRRSLATRAGSAISIVILGVAGIFVGWILGMNDRLIGAPAVFAAIVLLFGRSRTWISAIIAVAAMVFYGYLVIPVASGMALIVAVFALAVGLFEVLGRVVDDKSRRDHALVVLVCCALAGAAIAPEPITLVLLWELASVGFAVLVMRRTAAGRPGSPWQLVHSPALAGTALVTVGFVITLQAIVLSSGAPLPEVFGADGYIRLPALTGGWPAGRVVQTEAVGAAARVVGEQVNSIGELASAVPVGRLNLVFTLIAGGVLLAFGSLTLRPLNRPDHPQLSGSGSSPVGIPDLGIFVGFLLLTVMVGIIPGSILNPLLGWIGIAAALVLSVCSIVASNPGSRLRYAAAAHLGLATLAFSTATYAGLTSALVVILVRIIGFRALHLIQHASGDRPGDPQSSWHRQLRLVVAVFACVSLSGLPPGAGFAGFWLLVGGLFASGWWAHGVGALLCILLSWVFLVRFLHELLRVDGGPSHSDQTVPIRMSVPIVLVSLSGLLIAAVSAVPWLVVDPISMSIGIWYSHLELPPVMAMLGEITRSVFWYVAFGVGAAALAWFTITRGPGSARQGA